MWEIHYHVVMPVKYRKALIEKRVQRVLEETTEGIGERYEIEMEGLGCDKDHVHLLCGGHPKLAPGRIVQTYKSITAREELRRERWERKELWGDNIGRMATTLEQRGREEIGRRWSTMCANKENRKRN